MDDLRKPFFIAALILMLLVVLIEVGAGLSLRGVPPEAGQAVSQISSAPLPPSLQELLGDPDSASAVQKL
jgi:hypothetical protein